MEIKSILIANRGEIALRALRTIKEMGKKAICVYSEADKDALYLKYADASICIG
ncbi:biotin carboxylase N-terminal domain-containing protein, partial [Campylobacter jejuni]